MSIVGYPTTLGTCFYEFLISPSHSKKTFPYANKLLCALNTLLWEIAFAFSHIWMDECCLDLQRLVHHF